jgi:hypothetical protein
MSTTGKLATGSEKISVRFVRREARAQVHIPAWLTPDGGQPIVVDTVDLSPRGAAAISPRGVPPLTPVELFLDARHLPEGLSLPPLPALVKTTRRSGQSESGELLCRIGLSFQPMPPGTRRLLRTVTRRIIMGVAVAEGTGEAIDPLVAPALASSDRGRELLYQAAFEKLEQKQLDTAFTLAEWAQRGDPKNPFYRALVHRVRAEQSLAARECDDAAREVTTALELSPEDEDLVALRDHIEAVATQSKGTSPTHGTSRTYLTKLLRDR